MMPRGLFFYPVSLPLPALSAVLGFLAAAVSSYLTVKYLPRFLLAALVLALSFLYPNW
jgi:hypothetical protein